MINPMPRVRSEIVYQCNWCEFEDLSEKVVREHQKQHLV